MNVFTIQSVVQHPCVLSCKLCVDNPYHFLHTLLFHTFFQLFELHVSTNIGHLQALLRAIALYLLFTNYISIFSSNIFFFEGEGCVEMRFHEIQ
jgi:hypothetical protein